MQGLQERVPARDSGGRRGPQVRARLLHAKVQVCLLECKANSAFYYQIPAVMHIEAFGSFHPAHALVTGNCALQ